MLDNQRCYATRMTRLTPPLCQRRNRMPTLRALRWTVTGILLLIVPLSIGAAESPRDTLRSTIERLVMVLRDPTLQGDGRRQERVEKVREIVRPQFAFLEMAQQALGTHWRDRTEADQWGIPGLFSHFLGPAFIGPPANAAAGVGRFFYQGGDQGELEGVDNRGVPSAC